MDWINNIFKPWAEEEPTTSMSKPTKIKKPSSKENIKKKKDPISHSPISISAEAPLIGLQPDVTIPEKRAKSTEENTVDRMKPSSREDFFSSLTGSSPLNENTNVLRRSSSGSDNTNSMTASRFIEKSEEDHIVEAVDTAQAEMFGPITKVLDHIFLGGLYNIRTGNAIEECNIQVVLNVAAEWSHPVKKDEKKRRNVEFIKESIEDFLEKGEELPDSNAEISHSDYQKLFGVWDEIFEIIEGAVVQNQNVLVHCIRGRSRSPAIVIAYLMKYEKMSLKDAYLLLKKLRPSIGPHDVLKQQLLCFERAIHEETSLTLEEWRILAKKDCVDVFVKKKEKN